jgi:ABC-type amino acid transport substrate-binding protein
MRYIASAIVLVAALFAASPAMAQQKFTVGVEELEYFPQYRWNANQPAGKEYEGYARALLDAFAQAKGYEFTYVAFPVARLFNEFLDKRSVDFKYPDNAYWSAEAKKNLAVIYSDPAADYIDGVMVLPGKQGMKQDDLKTMGIIRGFTAFEYLDAIKGGTVKPEESTDYTSMLKMCMAGRVDGAYGNVAVANWNLKEKIKEPGALVFDPALPHTKSSYRLSSITHPEVIEEFNAWLGQNKSLVDSLKAQYQVESGVN